MFEIGRTLIAGRHRLEAAKKLGWAKIDAGVFPHVAQAAPKQK